MDLDLDLDLDLAVAVIINKFNVNDLNFNVLVDNNVEQLLDRLWLLIRLKVNVADFTLNLLNLWPILVESHGVKRHKLFEKWMNCLLHGQPVAIANFFCDLVQLCFPIDKNLQGTPPAYLLHIGNYNYSNSNLNWGLSKKQALEILYYLKEILKNEKYDRLIVVKSHLIHLLQESKWRLQSQGYMQM